MPEPSHGSDPPVVGIIMGSRSDWPVLEPASAMLTELNISHECQVVSAHRTPHRLVEYAESAADRGLEILIAGAGGAAHLPGMAASLTLLPVLGVPVESRTLKGIDSLLSIVQMPGGVPVGTLAIGTAGAKNAALLAARMLATRNSELRQRLEQHRDGMRDTVLSGADLTPEMNGVLA